MTTSKVKHAVELRIIGRGVTDGRSVVGDGMIPYEEVTNIIRSYIDLFGLMMEGR